MTERLAARLALTLFAVQTLCCLGLVLSGCSPQDAAAYGLRPGAPLRPARASASGAAADAGTPDSGVASFIDEYGYSGDGTSTYVNCNSQYAAIDGSSGSNPAITQFTGCARINGVPATGTLDVLGLSTSGSSNLGFKISVKNDGAVLGAVDGAQFSTGSGEYPGGWQIWCLTYNAGNVALIRVASDGTVTGVATDTGYGASITFSASNFTIGARPSPTTNFYDGVISETLVAVDALSTTEVGELVNGSGEYQDPEGATWAANLTFVGRHGDDANDDVESALRNVISGTDCTAVNYAAEDLVAGGEG